MIKDYFINFWIWWYYVKGKGTISFIFRYWMLVLGALNVVPMLANLFVPLYQDYSLMGRFVSFIIRAVWGVSGLFIFLIAGIPLWAVVFVHFALPIAIDRKSVV